jgi:hypothetical protein
MEQPSRNQIVLLGVSLASYATWRLHFLISIHRQDAKNAKKSAKQNSFQESKDFQLRSTENPSLLSEISVSSVSPWLKERREPFWRCPYN